MKTIDDFFENINFEFLHEKNKLEEKYQKIWEDVYLPSQEKKIKENNVEETIKNEAFNGLSKRGKFLCQLYEFFDFKNIAEVGTAEGYQFFTFCNYIKENKVIDANVYTCDIRDVRNSKYIDNYKDVGNFVLGTSNEMADKIIEDEKKIDLYWVDGAHTNGAVLVDVIRLAKTQSSNCVWIFDDFDERFGIYNELQFLANFAESRIISLGPTASGKPNNMLILKGPF
jgi:hypothetical protein